MKANPTFKWHMADGDKALCASGHSPTFDLATTNTPAEVTCSNCLTKMGITLIPANKKYRSRNCEAQRRQKFRENLAEKLRTGQRLGKS